jgi:hypothetical protein
MARAKRSGSEARRRDARTALQQLAGWQAYQKSAGTKEDVGKQIEEVTAALAKLDQSAAAR